MRLRHQETDRHAETERVRERERRERERVIEGEVKGKRRDGEVCIPYVLRNTIDPDFDHIL